MVIKWFWNLVNYIDGWIATRELKRNNPALYKQLCEEFNEENFEEVPGVPGLKLHKDALENMRKLGEEGHA
jgi:hypothetical protein